MQAGNTSVRARNADRPSVAGCRTWNEAKTGGVSIEVLLVRYIPVRVLLFLVVAIGFVCSRVPNLRVLVTLEFALFPIRARTPLTATVQVLVHGQAHSLHSYH
jgi:hypothetical protein